MAMNRPTILALERLTKLIDRLGTIPSEELIDEIKAWNRLLKKCLSQQKRQKGGWIKQRYEYDKRTKEIVRKNEHGDEINRQ